MSLAAIGAEVRERLLKTPGVHKLPARGFDLFVVQSFLTPKECAGLMARIDRDRRPSTVLGDDPDPEFRTSESCDLDPFDPLVRAVEKKITGLMGIDSRCGETIQGQRYDVGQQFKPHHDFFYTDQPYWEQMRHCGGQRSWTAMMFLNAPERGGQTFFERANARITPRPGNLLAWNNMDEQGNPNPASLHHGMPVEAGVKYVITKWYREGHWDPDGAVKARQREAPA